MTLRTDPIFYYGIEITSENNYIDLREGVEGEEISFQLPRGNYCLEELRFLLEDALNLKGSLNCYQVQIDRYSRKMTVSAEGYFEFLLKSGSNADVSLLNSFGLMTSPSYGGGSVQGPNGGYITHAYGNPHLNYGIEDTGLFTVHRLDGCVGQKFDPQFCIQDYRDADNNCALRNAVANESVYGECVEVISYGEDQFYDFNFKYITEKEMPCNGPIRNNPNALKDINSFLKWAIKKKVIEFIPNKNEPNIYHKIRLEKLRGNSKGTGYSLKELYNQGLPEFYETGIVTFRRL